MPAKQSIAANDIGRRIWASRYRWAAGAEAGQGESDIRATWHRTARALANVEALDPAGWEERFYCLLEDFRFLPGGRIQAGAGLPHHPSLFNCFVMPRPTSDAAQLVRCIDDLVTTMLAGGGVGYDFSNVSPSSAGNYRHAGDLHSGPLPILRVWDDLCAMLGAGRVRGGAMLGSLRCDHPDIEAFVAAKDDPDALTHFNLSVLVTDDFMTAVRNDADWPLVFPLAGQAPASESIVERRWPGSGRAVPCSVWRVTRARELWQALVRTNYAGAEPGLLFIDRIQRSNNLHYAEEICTTNPCGEVPLPCYGACDLGSLNLTRFVADPFTSRARLDDEAIRRAVPVAVRMLDNVYELSGFPLERQRDVATSARRVGLGFTGLADALIMLGLRYDSEAARERAAQLMRMIKDCAYSASVDLAREKGAFEQFSASDYLGGEFASRLPADVRANIARFGLRNSHLLALAPTGSISLLAGAVSSGIEPVHAYEYTRQVNLEAGVRATVAITDYAYRAFRRQFGPKAPLPESFCTSFEIDPLDQLAMHAVLQEHVDSAVSKTIAVAENYPYQRFAALYERAYDLGLKGCATYRQGSRRGSVIGGPGSAASRTKPAAGAALSP